MKAKRILLTILTVALVSACSATDITGPESSASQTEVQRGMFGSGQG